MRVDGDFGTGSGAREGGPQTGYDTARPARSLYETAREVILRPRDFFGGLSPDFERGPDHPVWFAVVIGTLTAPLILLNEAFDPLVRSQEETAVLGTLQNVAQSTGLLAAAGLALLFWVLAPLLIVAGLLQ